MRVFEKYTIDGVTTTIGSEDDKMVVKTEADIAPSLDHTSALRNDPNYSKDGIKKDWWHVAHIPLVAVHKMLTDEGFNVMNSHPKEVIAFLKKHKDKYGYLFTTEGRV